jgi:NAD dependent epimerase/dehydratase family enzyme
MLGEMADALLLASTRAVPNRLQQAGYSFVHSELEQALRAVMAKQS